MATLDSLDCSPTSDPQEASPNIPDLPHGLNAPAHYASARSSFLRFLCCLLFNSPRSLLVASGGAWLRLHHAAPVKIDLAGSHSHEARTEHQVEEPVGLKIIEQQPQE